MELGPFIFGKTCCGIGAMFYLGRLAEELVPCSIW